MSRASPLGTGAIRPLIFCANAPLAPALQSKNPDAFFFCFGLREVQRNPRTRRQGVSRPSNLMTLITPQGAGAHGIPPGTVMPVWGIRIIAPGAPERTGENLRTVDDSSGRDVWNSSGPDRCHRNVGREEDLRPRPSAEPLDRRHSPLFVEFLPDQIPGA
jgi:hypothetical protein